MRPIRNNMNVEILDCTIRDGGYVNNWDFDKRLVRETYRALSKGGVDYIELGYHGSQKWFDKKQYGAFRLSLAEDIRFVCNNIAGAKVAVMVDYGKFDVEELAQYKDTPVRLIRIAVHRHSIKKAIHAAAGIRRMGFLVAVNLMGFTLYTPKERKKVALLFRDAPIDYAYLVDSHGSFFPNQIGDICGPLFGIRHIRWGFHAHNNLQMAFANTLSAMAAGAHIIDSSVFGMGRGAGNLPTEIILAYMHLLKPEKYNAIPVLSLVDRYFTKLYDASPWGYNLPFMLSGIHDCHPDYPKNLINRKEYDIEDIWKILNAVRLSAPVGFNKELLEGIIRNGLFSKKPAASGVASKANTSKRKKTSVSYRGRHRNADFLVLANGPSLKSNHKQLAAFISKYQPIVLASNYLGGLFKPHYHAFSNKRRLIDYIDTVDKSSRLLISQFISPQMIREYTDRDHETIYYENTDAQFTINDGVISSHCRTVALLLLGVAIVMGARRIFVAGLDGYTGINKKGQIHFYNEKDETEDRNVLMEKHMSNLRYLEQIDEYMCSHGKEGIHIITPTNYTKYYKGIENYISK